MFTVASKHFHQPGTTNPTEPFLSLEASLESLHNHPLVQLRLENATAIKHELAFCVRAADDWRKAALTIVSLQQVAVILASSAWLASRGCWGHSRWFFIFFFWRVEMPFFAPACFCWQVLITCAVRQVSCKVIWLTHFSWSRWFLFGLLKCLSPFTDELTPKSSEWWQNRSAAIRFLESKSVIYNMYVRDTRYKWYINNNNKYVNLFYYNREILIFRTGSPLYNYLKLIELNINSDGFSISIKPFSGLKFCVPRELFAAWLYF